MLMYLTRQGKTFICLSVASETMTQKCMGPLQRAIGFSLNENFELTSPHLARGQVSVSVGGGQVSDAAFNDPLGHD